MSQEPPPPAASLPASEPASEPVSGGAGLLVPAGSVPSASVGGPVEAQTINVLFGIGAVVLLVVTVAVVVLLAIFVLNLVRR